MDTRVDEIADGIFRLSTLVPDAAAGGGLTFNQFLIRADQPLLFHTGHRAMFGQVSQAASRVLPVESLRWIAFGHVEADECGSMNQWLAAAPGSASARTSSPQRAGKAAPALSTPSHKSPCGLSSCPSNSVPQIPRTS